MIHIRRAAASDWHTIVRIGRVLGSVEGADASVFGAIMADDRQAVIVAENQGDGVVGWVHAAYMQRVLSGGFAEICGIAVSEDCRRTGVGRALVAAVREWASGHGGRARTSVRVRVREDRTDAHAFYRSLGFMQTKAQLVFDEAR